MGPPGNAGILPAPGFAGFQPASRRQDACVPRDTLQSTGRIAVIDTGNDFVRLYSGLTALFEFEKFVEEISEAESRVRAVVVYCFLLLWT